MPLLLAACLAVLARASGAPLKAAVGKVDITPPAGTPMWGYAARHGPATGTLDPLFARILVLDDGSTRIALVTLDLGRSFGTASLTRLKDAVRKSSNVLHVLATASHTHSGPRIRDEYPTNQVPAWETVAIDKIAGTIEEATKHLVEVRIGAGYGSTFIGHNRIEIEPDGTAKWFGRNPTKVPTAPADPTLGVLRIDKTDGQPLAILVNYACHPVVFGHDNLQFSADYPAAMARTVEQAFNQKPLCFFIQGAPGDINPFYAETPVQEAADKWRNWTGTQLGEEAVRVAKRIESQPEPNGHIDYTEDVDTFHLRWDPDKFRQGVLKVWGPDAFSAEAPEITPEMQLPVITMLINRQIAFMTMPGEPFVNFQIDWRNRCPVKAAFFAGYTDGYFGYFPTIKAATLAAYGASSSSTWVEVGAGERMLNQALIRIYEDLGDLHSAPLESR